ncbi:hypothetical protein, partial [Crocosphaera watsonii]|uniref:hypothetical protein n=1 Tax=Crocosphaera watsonii TaxID=263511 RepID=UPI000B1762D5
MISEFYQFYLAAMNDFSEQIAALSPSEAMNSEQRSQPTRENQIKAEKYLQSREYYNTSNRRRFSEELLPNL